MGSPVLVLSISAAVTMRTETPSGDHTVLTRLAWKNDLDAIGVTRSGYEKSRTEEGPVVALMNEIK